MKPFLRRAAAAAAVPATVLGLVATVVAGVKWH